MNSLTFRRTRQVLGSAAAAVVVVATLTAPAAAAPSHPANPAPTWSGMDTRQWTAPVPAPGAVAATTPLDPALSLPQAGRAVRQVYGTIDQHGQPAISTSVVFLPHGVAPEGGWPVVAWAHGTTGLGDDCAPSTQPRSDRDAEYL
ncbi:alpha/beta hydrolase, partial [Dietzia sp. NPDC055343]